MTQRSATPDLPPDFALGVSAIDVSLLATSGDQGAPSIIKIFPRGEITTRDGRRYLVDPDRLVARFLADGVHVPIDVDHEIPAKVPGAVAKGWVTALEARADGLYGTVEWLDGGKAVLKARTHRYISPAFHHTKEGEAIWLHSVSLVPAPALSGQAAVASTDPTTTENPMSKAIAAALGLAADAGEAACLTAIDALQNGTVAKAVHEQTLATLAATTKELDELKAKIRQEKVDQVIAGALADKKIVPAQEAEFRALCADDKGLAHVVALLAATPKGLQASALDKAERPATGEAEGDPVKLAAEAQAYQAEQRKAGIEISIADAVAHVKEKAK